MDGPEGAATLPAYMPAETVHVPAGREHVLVHVPARGVTVRLTAQTSLALQSCHGLAPLRQHAVQVARAFGLHPSQAEALERQFLSLVALGLFVRGEEALARGRAAGAQVTRGHVTCLAVPTRDRPALLARGLPEFVENALDFGRRLRVVVVDDSRQAASRAANEQLLATLGRRYGIDLRCVGVEARARFARALAERAGVAPAVTEFALLNPEGCPLAFGAARNAVLLATVGEVLVQVDDDTRCSIAAAPGARTGVCLSSRDDPTEFHFFEQAAGPRAALDVRRHDFVGLHEELLGRGVGACADEGYAADELAWDLPTPEFLAKLGASARVGVSSLGIAGDCGMDTPLHYLFVGDAARQRLWGDRADASHAFYSRQVVRAAWRRTISDTAHCASTNLGLDNRAELPPFFPVQRNEDGCFGTALHTCARSIYSGFLPHVLFHEPVPERRFDAQQVWARPGALATGDWVRLLMGSFQGWPWGDETAANLRALGRYLGDCARASDFEGLLRAHYVRWVGARLANIERRLRVGREAPAAWRRDFERYRDALQAGLGRDDLALPADLAGERGRDGALALLRTLVGRYALLLQEWPHLRAAAAELRQRGEGLDAAPP